MDGVLKVCRLGQHWIIKDESGKFWGLTPQREKAEEAAAARAKEAGLRVIVRDEQGAMG